MTSHRAVLLTIFVKNSASTNTNVFLFRRNVNDVSFGVLTLLVGRQEGRPACK